MKAEKTAIAIHPEVSENPVSDSQDNNCLHDVPVLVTPPSLTDINHRIVSGKNIVDSSGALNAKEASTMNVPAAYLKKIF